MARRRVIPRTCIALTAAVLALAGTDCYSNDDGQAPPLNQLYFPVGLQVSAGGNVLYVVNSDFDLQYNGGTIQSYDLTSLRQDVLQIIDDHRSTAVPIINRAVLEGTECPERGQPTNLGQSCAPPVDSSKYFRDAVIVGAFATDLVLSKPPSQLIPSSPRTSLDEEKPLDNVRRFDRLYSPIRGNASLTWISVERDRVDQAPSGPDWPPFKLQCGKDATSRCDLAHLAGSNPEETGNTRRITMPGEPFGMTISQDGESILVTHQNEQRTSLFSTGQSRGDQDTAGDARDLAPSPALQFVLEGVPIGGVGLAAVPHDRDAYFDSPSLFPRNAFLQTSRSAALLALLRRYPDEIGGVGDPRQTSSLRRPFLDFEGSFDVAIGAGGTDSRGVAIDPTPRLECKARVAPVDVAKGRLEADVKRDLQICARKPARIFIANRSPASLLIGEVGGSATANDEYNPDRVQIHTSIPLSAGPSKVYLAPVVESDGRYGLRVFVTCFDLPTLYVFDPARNEIENVFRVGVGPFAMAFDPFTFEDVAKHTEVPVDTRIPGRAIHRYRFAYLASFTESYIQVIDLDNAHAKSAVTFERIVFTLGQPTAPKGS